MKLILGIGIIVLILSAYQYATHVSFKHNRASVSKLYCSLFASKHIPQDPVIFVHGIKGSILEDTTGTRWLRLIDAIKPTAPLTYSDNDGIRAVGLLTRLTVIPYFIGYRPYQYISAQLACAPHAYFHYYDWRGYPQDNAKALGELVDRVIKETGKKPSIVAHSMGGLVTHGYLKTNTSNLSKVNKLVYVSVPFDPGVSYFDDVNEGRVAGLNKNITSKEALITQPASFLLLPHHGSDKYAGIELMDADVWKKQGYGAFGEGTADIENVRKMIKKIRSYHDILDTPQRISNPTRVIMSECFSSVHLIDNNGTRIFYPSDGRVAKVSAYPKDKMSNLSEASYCVKHDIQLDNKEIVEDVFTFLNAE